MVARSMQTRKQTQKQAYNEESREELPETNRKTNLVENVGAHLHVRIQRARSNELSVRMIFDTFNRSLMAC